MAIFASPTAPTSGSAASTVKESSRRSGGLGGVRKEGRQRTRNGSAPAESEWDTAFDSHGDLYIADTGNHRVRRVDPTGVITSVAGNGDIGLGGDGGKATSASLEAPSGVAVDSQGNLYIVDPNDSTVREVDPAGVIRTVAAPRRSGSRAMEDPAKSASLESMVSVAVDDADNVYLLEPHDARVRRIDGNGIITTIAGNGSRTDSESHDTGEIFLGPQRGGGSLAQSRIRGGHAPQPDSAD